MRDLAGLFRSVFILTVMAGLSLAGGATAEAAPDQTPVARATFSAGAREYVFEVEKYYFSEAEEKPAAVRKVDLKTPKYYVKIKCVKNCDSQPPYFDEIYEEQVEGVISTSRSSGKIVLTTLGSHTYCVRVFGLEQGRMTELLSVYPWSPPGVEADAAGEPLIRVNGLGDDRPTGDTPSVVFRWNGVRFVAGAQQKTGRK